MAPTWANPQVTSLYDLSWLCHKVFTRAKQSFLRWVKTTRERQYCEFDRKYIVHGKTLSEVGESIFLPNFGDRFHYLGIQQTKQTHLKWWPFLICKLVKRSYNIEFEFEFVGVLRHMQRYFSQICDGTDVQADWRSYFTYGRAPNAIDISQGSLTCPSYTDTGPTFLYGDSNTPPL